VAVSGIGWTVGFLNMREGKRLLSRTGETMLARNVRKEWNRLTLAALGGRSAIWKEGGKMFAREGEGTCDLGSAVKRGACEVPVITDPRKSEERLQTSQGTPWSE